MGCGVEQVSGQQFVYFTKNGQTVISLIINVWIAYCTFRKLMLDSFVSC